MKNLLLYTFLLFGYFTHAQYVVSMDSVHVAINGKIIPDKLSPTLIKQLAGPFTTHYTHFNAHWEDGRIIKPKMFGYGYPDNGFYISFFKVEQTFAGISMQIQYYRDERGNKNFNRQLANQLIIDGHRMDTSTTMEEVRQILKPYPLVFEDEVNLYKQVYSPMIQYLIGKTYLRLYFLPDTKKLRLVRID